jgi:hypothetical protein
MEIEHLRKEDFDSFRNNGTVPTVRFTKDGVVIINHVAMKHLRLSCDSRVSIGFDKKDPSEFVVFKSDNGWRVRVGKHNEGIFNSMGLVRHIIDATWKRRSHVPGENKPCSISFRVARLPVDDGKNKDVYALIRKKE